MLNTAIAVPLPQGLQAKLVLEKGKIIRILGPAKIYVESGCIRILGVDLCKGQEIWISKYRSYAVKAVDVSTLSVIIGEGGAVEEPSPGEEPIDEWENIAREIVSRGGRVVVLGPIESGKTSFSTFLSNLGIENGLKTVLIDADVGQCDLAPPGFIAMKFMDRKVIWLRELVGDLIRFIGFITPAYSLAMARIITSVMELVNIAEEKGSQLIIINTDGWFGDLMSIEFKIQLIRSVKPSSVVIMGNKILCEQLSNIFTKFSLPKVYCVSSPMHVRKRDRDDRRQLRRINYMQYLQKAKKRCFNINSIAILNSCLFNGTLITDDLEQLRMKLGIEAIMASKYEDLLVVAVSDDTKVDRMQIGSDNVYIIKPSHAKGALVALLNENMEEVGMGIIESIDLLRKEICILTEYEGVVKGVSIGRIIVSEEYADKGKVMKCII